MHQDFDRFRISGENNKLCDTAIQGFRSCKPDQEECSAKFFLNQEMALLAAIYLR